MAKQNKDNEKARRQLRQLKEEYGLTWPEMAKVFERSLSAIEGWYQGKKSIPKPYEILIQTYIDSPQLFKKKKVSVIKK